MSKGIIESLLPAVDSILGVRDSAGAVIDKVYFVTRSWEGGAVGEGIPTDAKVQMLPSPALKNYSQDVRLREGGSVKAGDIILQNVSRNKYQESDLNGISASQAVQKFYLVGAKLYQVISITKSYVTWNVQLRELADQSKYGV